MTNSPPQNLLDWRKQEEAAYAAEDWAGLVEALVGQAALVPDPAEAAGTLCRAGCAALRASDPDRAIELFEQVKGAPSWERLARIHLLEIHWSRSAFEDVVKVIEAELAGDSPWDAKVLRLEKARIKALRLGLVDEAQSELESLLSEDPECREALWLRLALFLRSGAWEKVLETYRRIFELASADDDPALMQSSVLRLAQVCEFRFGRRDEAEAWRLKMEDARSRVHSVYPLFELAEGAGDWQKSAGYLSDLIAALSGEGGGPPALRFLLARIKADGLDDQAGADADMRDLAGECPDDFAAVYAAAERALETGPAEVRADLDLLVMSLLSDPDEKRFFMADRVRIMVEDLSDPAAAVADARQLVELSPDDVSASRWLIESLVRSGDFAGAAEEMERELSRTRDPREKQALLIRKAELCAHKAGDGKAALDAYRRALEVPPSTFPILLSMAGIYHQNRDYENLSRVLTAAMKLVTDPVVKRFYQGRLAAILIERLAREDQAFALYGEMIKADQQDRAVLKNIARISNRNGSWANLQGALKRIADQSGDAALAAEVRARIAWINEVRLDKKKEALEGYKELSSAGQAFSQEGARRLHYQGGDLASYAGVIRNLADHDAGPLRAARLVRLAAVQEVLGELSEAWASYEKARVSLMQEPLLFLPMIDLAQLSGYWGRYVNMIEEFAGRLLDPGKKALLWEAAWSHGEIPAADGKIDAGSMLRSFRALEEVSDGWQGALRGSWLASLWAQDDRARADTLARMIKLLRESEALTLKAHLGGVLRDDLGAGEEAIAVLRQVLAADQKSAPLIRELQLMYEHAGQWGELIRMMLLEVPLRKDPVVLVDIYGRLAGLYEQKFQAVDEAIKCHQAILKMEPARVGSHREKIRLLEAKGRWEEMVAALLAFVAVAAETDAKIGLLAKAAFVCDEKLSDPDRAITNLRTALDLDPAREDTLSALEKIYQREQRWPDLVGVLEEQTGRVEDAAVKTTLFERMADILENKIGDNDNAIAHLITARDLEPGRGSVLASLERLFTQAARWEELIDTLERLAQMADDAGKIGYFSRIGELWDRNLSDSANAVASWERVRDLDSINVPALEALVSLYERTGGDGLFVERSVSLAELVAEDKARAVTLLCKAGSVLETRIEDDDRALGLYGRAMEIDESSVTPIAAARSIHEKREAWPEVIALLLREEGVTGEVGRKLELFTLAGNLHETRLEDEEQAAASYERAVALQGDHLPAVAPLSEIYFKAKSWDRARPLFEIRTGQLEGISGADQAELWFKAGWCAEQGQDVEAAMARYHSSEKAAPAYRPPLERLGELYTSREKWEEAAAFTERLLAVIREARDNEAAVVLLRRLGMVLEKLGRLDGSVDAYEQSLAIKPGHYETLARLVDLYLRLENWKKALAAYDLLIRNAPNPQARAEGLYGKGVVLEDRVNEEQSALAHFNKAVEVLPAHKNGWERIAAIHLRRSAWPEAERALIELVKLETDQALLVEHRCNLGRVYFEGLSNLAQAREQFEEALKLDAVHIPSMRSLGDIYLKQEEWRMFIDTSEKFIKLVPPESQRDLIPLFIKMGEVYRDHIKNTERAIISCQQVIKLQPENEQARSELAALYISDPKFVDMAKTENLSLIRLQPWRVQSYRDLARIYKKQNHLDAQFCIYYIQNMLGSLDYEEQMFFDANRERVVHQSKRTLKDIERESNLIHPDERGPLRDMMIAVADQMVKTFPPPLDKFGAKKQNLLTKTSETPIKDLAIEILENLGAEPFNMYLVPQNMEPMVFYTSPPSLTVSTEWFARFKPMEQRFIMGRLIEQLTNRHSLVMLNPAPQVVRSLCILAMAADPSVNLVISGLSEALLEKEKKNMRKLINRKNRGQIEHAAQRFSQDTADTDPAKWRKAMTATGNRAGLLVCGDLKSAFDAIIKTDPQYRTIKYEELGEPMTLWEKNEDIVELLIFSVSDSYFRLRDRMGFAIA